MNDWLHQDKTELGPVFFDIEIEHMYAREYAFIRLQLYA